MPIVHSLLAIASRLNHAKFLKCLWKPADLKGEAP